MPTSLEKISSGLKQAQAAKSGSISLLALKSAPSTLSDLSKLASQADAKRTRLREITSGIVSAIEQYESKAAAKWAEVGYELGEGGVRRDTLGESKRRKCLKDDVAKYRRDALKISAEERAKLREEIAAIRRNIEAVKALWLDPVSILQRSTLPDPNRATFAANLANAGVREVEAALQTAILTNDRALASAAFQRLDSMDKRSREHVGISRQQVAETLMEREWGIARRAIMVAEIAADEAEIANDEAEGRSISSHRKITLGTKKADLNKLLPATGDEDDDKQRSGETWEQFLDRKYPGLPGSTKAEQTPAADDNEDGWKAGETFDEYIARVHPGLLDGTGGES